MASKINYIVTELVNTDFYIKSQGLDVHWSQCEQSDPVLIVLDHRPANTTDEHRTPKHTQSTERQRERERETEIFLWGHSGYSSLFPDFKVALTPPFPSTLKLMTELFLGEDSSGPERILHRDV